jgi:hypothetical protein
MAGLITTARDDRWLEAIVPARISAAEAARSRTAPPTLLANLILKNVDGTRNLAAILAAMTCTERALGEELKLLIRMGWVRLVAGQELYNRYLAG